MRKKPYIALVLASASLQGYDYCCFSRDIEFLADYAYLNRSQVHDFSLVRRTISPGREKTILDIGDLVEDMDSQSAIRGGILYHHSPSATLEAIYTFVLPWEGRKTNIGAADLSYAFRGQTPLLGFINANAATAKYRSWFQNGEFNYWIHVTPQYVNYFSFSWDMGFRVILLEEHFNLQFTKPLSVARYSIKTNNNLYGVQLGAMLEINPTDYWTWSFLIKGAAFADRVRRNAVINDPSSAVQLNYSKAKLASTCLLEGYAQLAYHWTSFFSFHAGYQGFILSGIAIAPEQRVLKSIPKSSIRVKGQVVINGMYVGLSLRF